MSQADRGKLGANAECWCGSGKKFKHCHKGSSDLPRHRFYDFAKHAKQEFTSKSDRICIAPSEAGYCGKKAIRCHSISKASFLSPISIDSHVYSMENDPFAMSSAEPKLKRSGINEASIFYGFCSEHDAALFQPIDSPDFPLTEEAIFALHYRALCKELYVKRPAVRVDKTLKQFDRGMEESAQRRLHDILNFREKVTDLALNELEDDKRQLDALLLRKAFGNLHYCSLSFSGTPILACAGYTQPVFDFGGSTLQNFNTFKHRVHALSFSVVPQSGGQKVIFSWLTDGDGPCRKFVESLLKVRDEDKASCVIQYAFNSFENLAIHSDWWDQIDAAARAELKRQMNEWIGPAPHYHLVHSNALKPSKLKFVDWVFNGNTCNC